MGLVVQAPVLGLVRSLPVKGIAHITGGGLLGNVPRVLRDGLQALQAAYPTLFAEVRGCGLMLGLALADGLRGRAKEFVRLCERHHLLVLMAGPDVVRLLPALVVSDGEIDEALARLRSCAAEFTGSARG